MMLYPITVCTQLLDIRVLCGRRVILPPFLLCNVPCYGGGG